MWFPNSQNWFNTTFTGSSVSVADGVVDLLDVALRARGANDVGWIGHPPLEPLEALAAHVLREDGDAAAVHDAGDRDTTAA